MFQASIVRDNIEPNVLPIGEPIETCAAAWNLLVNTVQEKYNDIIADPTLVGSGRLDAMEQNDLQYEALMNTPWGKPGETVVVGDRTYKVESIADDPA